MSSGEVTIRPLTPADAAEVARLHQTQIDAGFLSSLGHGVLMRMYRGLPLAAAGFGFVAEKDGQIVGYIACATNLKKLYRAIFRRQGLAIGVRLLRFMISPRVIRKIWQTAFYPSKVDCCDYPEAEILSVVTSPAARGTGVGSRLMQQALDEFGRRGCDRVKVLVGETLEPANSYYQRHEFELAAKIEHHDRMENIYVKKVDSQSGHDDQGD